jgi:hypothetical protein
MNDPNELKREADRFGLTNLTDRQMEQFARAKATAEGLVNGVSRDLHMYDEPAHTFRADEET